MSRPTTIPFPDDNRPTSNRILREPTGSIAPHILLFSIQLLALVAPPFRHRRSLVTAATVLLMATYLSHPHFSNDFGLAQPFSLAWSTYLASLEKLVAVPSPEACFWRVDMPAREALAYSAFGFQKLRWALVLVLNMRAIRWNHQVPHVPPLCQACRSRAGFLAWRIAACTYYLLMADLVSQLAIHFFYTAPDGRVGAVDSKYLTLRADNWAWSFAKTLVFGATPYYMVQLQYTVFSIVAVLSGLSKPEDWPASFGTLSDVTTVRAFWGKYWHQTLRRLFNTYTTAFVDAAGIRHGTNLSSYTQLWLAFLMSGLGHAASILVLPSPANISLPERTAGLVQFFLSQAAVITFEDAIQWSWTRLWGKSSAGAAFRSAVGYAWVIGTLRYTLPWAGDVFVRMRLGEDPVLPFTVAGPWVKTLPVP